MITIGFDWLGDFFGEQGYRLWAWFVYVCRLSASDCAMYGNMNGREKEA